jgi:hypothetical protein
MLMCLFIIAWRRTQINMGTVALLGTRNKWA